MRSNRVLAALLLVAVLTVVPMAGAAQSDALAADLYVEQPTHADGGVAVNETADGDIYEVSGDRLLISVQNVDHDDIQRFGVQEETASLEWDSRLELFVLEPDADGTYHLTWYADETVAVQDGNETETIEESNRYEAAVRVDETDAVVLSASEHNEMATAADNWQQWESRVESISGPDADIEQETELAASMLDLRRNMLSALTGEFWQLGIVLFASFSGIMWLLVFGVYHYIDKRQLSRELNKREGVLPDYGELEAKLSELEHKQEVERMVTTRPSDWYDDPHIGQAATEAHGEDMMSHLSAFSEMVSGTGALRDRLVAMRETGYLVDTSGETPMLHPPTDRHASADGGTVQPLADCADEEFENIVSAVDPADPVIREFSYDECDAPRESFRTESNIPTTWEEMLESVDEQLHRFGADSELYGEYLQALLEDVLQHPTTGRDNTVSTQRYMIEQWYRVAIEGRDIFGVPITFQAEALDDLLQDHDPVEEAERIVEAEKHGEDAFNDGDSG